jgi:hypothetical protein
MEESLTKEEDAKHFAITPIQTIEIGGKQNLFFLPKIHAGSQF